MTMHCPISPWSRVITLLIGLMLLSGCAVPPRSGQDCVATSDSDATVYVNSDVSGIQQVAILPFIAPSELISRSVSELFVKELLISRRYRLVDRSQVSRIMEESELAMSGMTTAQAAQIGAMVGADAVIIGTVAQYEMTAYMESAYPVIDIDLRMIDCKSGRIGWSVDLAKQSTDRRASLSTHSRELVHEMMVGLYGQLMHYNPPAVPQGLTVSDRGLREATLAWHRPSDRKVTYQIERAKSASGKFDCVGQVAAGAAAYVDKGLADARTYYYRITAMGPNGVKAGPSGVVETFTAPPPLSPDSLQTSDDLVGAIALEWGAPPETTYVKGFRVERAERSSGPFTVLVTLRGIDKRSFIDGGREPGRLDDGRNYFYRVMTLNAADVASRPSTVVKGSTRATPPMVAAFSGQSNCPREVRLAWEVSPDTKVVGYRIYRQEEGGTFTCIETVKGRASAQWADRGTARRSAPLGTLKDGTDYHYRIAAYNIGNVASPDSVTITAATKQAPAQPRGLTAAGNAVRQSELAWSPNPEKDIARYRVEVASSVGGRFRSCATVEKTALINPELDDGTEYFYRVIAIDQATLESAASDVVAVTTKPCPSVPTSLASQKASLGGYMLSWDAPVERDVTSYTIFKRGYFSKSVVGYSNEPEFLLTADQIGRKLIVFVTASNADAQESVPSDTHEIRPDLPRPQSAW